MHILPEIVGTRRAVTNLLVVLIQHRTQVHHTLSPRLKHLQNSWFSRNTFNKNLRITNDSWVFKHPNTLSTNLNVNFTNFSWPSNFKNENATTSCCNTTSSSKFLSNILKKSVSILENRIFLTILGPLLYFSGQYIYPIKHTKYTFIIVVLLKRRSGVDLTISNAVVNQCFCNNLVKLASPNL